MGKFIEYLELDLLYKVPEIYQVANVIATEKIHGTNMRIMIPAEATSVEQIMIGGHHQVLGTFPFVLTMGGQIASVVKSNQQLFEDLIKRFYNHPKDWFLFGEAYGFGIQKGIQYFPEKEVDFRAFNISLNEFYQDRSFLLKVQEDVPTLKVAPLIYEGPPRKEIFDSLLEWPSNVAALNGIDIENNKENTAEGIVIQSEPFLKTKYGNWIITKHKAKRWEERAKKSNRQRDPESDRRNDLINEFVIEFVNEVRVEHSIDKLREERNWKADMSDMKYLGPYVFQDLKKEVMDEMNVLLTNEDLQIEEKHVHKGTTQRVAKLYREMLESQKFEGLDKEL